MTCAELMALRNMPREPTTAEFAAAMKHIKGCSACWKSLTENSDKIQAQQSPQENVADVLKGVRWLLRMKVDEETQ
jgi:hypothetical protein